MKNVFKEMIVLCLGVFIGYKTHEWLEEISFTEDDIEYIDEDAINE